MTATTLIGTPRAAALEEETVAEVYCMMALLMSGQAQMVIAGGVAILRGIAHGAPVVIIGGELSRMSYALMGAKGVKSVSDLKGKMVGITGIGGLGEFAVVESLKRNGLTKDRDYTLLNIEGGTTARMAALRAGKVQAVPLTPGQRVQAEKEGLPVILDTRDSLAEFPSTLVASTREFTAAHPEQAVGFLRALSKAMGFIRKNKDKAIELGKLQGMNRYRAKGYDKMPVAFALGHHPAFEVAAGSNCA